MGKFSNVAHYQDFTELKKILSASAANTYDMDKIEKAYKICRKRLTVTSAEYREFRTFFIPFR